MAGKNKNGDSSDGLTARMEIRLHPNSKARLLAKAKKAGLTGSECLRELAENGQVIIKQVAGAEARRKKALQEQYDRDAAPEPIPEPLPEIEQPDLSQQYDNAAQTQQEVSPPANDNVPEPQQTQEQGRDVGGYER